jgi:hypothetical protein
MEEFSWFGRCPDYFRTPIIQSVFEEIAVQSLHLKTDSCKQMFPLKSKDTVKSHGLPFPCLDYGIVFADLFPPCDHCRSLCGGYVRPGIGFANSVSHVPMNDIFPFASASYARRMETRPVPQATSSLDCWRDLASRVSWSFPHGFLRILNGHTHLPNYYQATYK